MALIPSRASNLLPADNSTLIRPESFDLGFTQSEITTWDGCAEKWYLGYNHQLHRRGAWNDHFVYGDAFHSTLEHWYRTGEEKIARLQLPSDVKPTGEDDARLRKWQAILDVQMRRYFIYYQDDLAAMTPFLVEEVVEFKHQGVKLTGKIDLGYEIDGQKGNYLSDHKSSSRFDMQVLSGWYFRFQFMFYLWLCQKVTGRTIHFFVINGLKKPALKQAKDESLESFVVRIEQDMIQRPEEYFKRVSLPTIKGTMEHFEERVLQPKIDRIKLLTQSKTPAIVIESLVRNQNTDNCVKYGSCCPFLPICEHGFKKEGQFYTRRENKHEELEAE